MKVKTPRLLSARRLSRQRPYAGLSVASQLGPQAEGNAPARFREEIHETNKKQMKRR